MIELLYKAISGLVFRLQSKISTRTMRIYNPSVIVKGHLYHSISSTAHISIGENMVINSGPNCGIIARGYSRINVKEGAFLKIGKNFGMTNTSIHCWEKIEIGNFVNVGACCMITDTNFHTITPPSLRENRQMDVKNAKTKPIKICDRVFIGACSIILKGVEIGENSVVQAGSVVVSNIPSNEIWGGAPAKFIKKMDIVC